MTALIILDGYGINPKDLELQDLKQVVWMEYDQIMKRKFRNKKRQK